MGHIENFFAFMSCSTEQMGHKKEVLRHMSQSKEKGDIKGKFYVICPEVKKKEGRKKKVLRHMSRSQKKEGHEKEDLSYMS